MANNEYKSHTHSAALVSTWFTKFDLTTSKLCVFDTYLGALPRVERYRF